MSKKSVLVIGGRGFVGSAICKRLSKDFSVYTFDRHEGSKNHIMGDIMNTSELVGACKGKSVVINLVGLSPIRKYTFDEYHQVHVVGTSNILDACSVSKVKRYIHMGALGSSDNALHPYLRTKALAIDRVKKSSLNWVIMNPSVILDEENELVRTLSKLSVLRFFPRITTRLQPVQRSVVAEEFFSVVKGSFTGSKDLVGKRVITVFDLAKEIFISKGRRIIPLPAWFVKPLMWLFMNSNLYLSVFTDSVSVSKSV